MEQQGNIDIALGDLASLHKEIQSVKQDIHTAKVVFDEITRDCHVVAKIRERVRKEFEEYKAKLDAEYQIVEIQLNDMKRQYKVLVERMGKGLEMFTQIGEVKV